MDELFGRLFRVTTATGETCGVGRVRAGEPTPDFDAGGIDDAHGVAGAEVATDAEDADGEHALAFAAHGRDRAGIEDDVAASAQRERDPVLFRGQAIT